MESLFLEGFQEKAGQASVWDGSEIAHPEGGWIRSWLSNFGIAGSYMLYLHAAPQPHTVQAAHCRYSPCL